MIYTIIESFCLRFSDNQLNTPKNMTIFIDFFFIEQYYSSFIRLSNTSYFFTKYPGYTYRNKNEYLNSFYYREMGMKIQIIYYLWIEKNFNERIYKKDKKNFNVLQ